MFNQALILSATLLLWTPSLGAQQSHQEATGAGQEAGMMANCMMQSRGMGEGEMDMMSGDMGMMSSSVPGPALLIRMGQILDLTEKQITDLEAIQADARAVLTDEQRARLDGAMGMMRHMESMRDGGMQGMSDQDSDTARHEHGASPGR